jgi:hypothetical protein
VCELLYGIKIKVGADMRFTTFLVLISLLVLMSACNKKAEPIVPTSVDQVPALTIAKESRDQLQKAKDVAKVLDQSAEKQKQAIDDISGNNSANASKPN